MQNTGNVIDALEGERNRLIADLLSNEIVDNILNWMLEGWYFGERESEFPALGYVPSLRKEGPIRLFEAQELAHAKGLKDRGEEAEQRGDPEGRIVKVSACYFWCCFCLRCGCCCDCRFQRCPCRCQSSF